MSRLTIQTSSADATHRVGAALGVLAEPGDVVLLTGDLGAGKTQLVKGLAQSLGVSGTVTSPTFNILLVHEGRIPLYHVDLYRLERAEELEDIDYFGTLEAGGVAAVEWGDRFERAAPADHLRIALHIHGDTDRLLDFEGFGTRAEALISTLAGSLRGVQGVRIVGAERYES